MKRLVIDVEDEHIELDVASNFNMDPVRDLICSMVRRALGFDQYSQDVFVRVRVYKDEA